MSLAPGTRLGPYEIATGIGTGGMGEVYRAHDHRLGRDVAVKVLPTHFKPGSRQLKQFEAEARLLASLNHPSICAIYDVGTDRGVSFMVMEHLRGETLSSRISRGPIPINVVVAYAVQIAEALRAAHEAGLVHRDIKPGNVMLTTNGVKLLDFGLAKRHMTAGAGTTGSGSGTPGSGSGSDAPDTGYHEGVVGTLHYMAPEQLAGTMVDARSDIWAFGCVIYEMVTGHRPFNGKNLTELIAAIVSEPPPAMTLDRGVVPLALGQVVTKCLARDPAQRWQSAAEVLKELRSMLPHTRPDSGVQAAPPTSSSSVQPVVVPSGSAAPVPIPTPPARTAGRLKAWGTAAAVAVGLVGGAVGYRVLGPTPIGPARLVAVLPFTMSDAHAGPEAEYLGDGLAADLTADLDRVPGLRTIPTRAVFDHRAFEPSRAGLALGAGQVVTGKISLRPDRITVDPVIVDASTGAESWRGHVEESRNDTSALERALVTAISKGLGAPGSADTAALEVVGPEAHRLFLRGLHAANSRDERSQRAAIDLFTQASARDPRLGQAFAGIAVGYATLAHFPALLLMPADALPSAKSAAGKAIALDPSLGSAHIALGLVKALYERDWRGAGTEFATATELQPRDPAPHQWRSEWLMATGRADEALTEARTAVQLDRLSVPAGLNLGWQLYLARKYPEAIAQLKSIGAPPDPDVRWALGMTYLQTGQVKDALAELRAAVAAAPNKPLYLSGLGYACGRGGRADEAAQLLARLRSMASRLYVSSFDLALVSLGLDDYAQTFNSLQLAVDGFEPSTMTLAVDPRLDVLRPDSRFQELLKRSGL